MQEESRKELAKLKEERAAIVQAADDEGRSDLNEGEEGEFHAKTEALTAKATEIEERQVRIDELVESENRADAAGNALRRAGIAEARVNVTNEARTYTRESGRSYFRDLVRNHLEHDGEAGERLARHAMEVLMEPEYQEYRDINRTDTTGGFFVPPAWLMEQFVPLARAGRPTANLIMNEPLPPGTDSINVPKISTGTATAIQTADNAATQETDLADTSVACGVKTISGLQDVAIQLLEQSPLNFDQIIFGDLMGDYATKVDVQVISGSNASGQVKGILSASGTNAITYTDTTPTVGELYSKLADGVQQIHTGRFLSPTVIVMHPRRWAWFLAAVDSNTRPLVVPNAQGPTNAIGSFEAVGSQTVVGSLQGLPVVTDPSIPTNLGAGTNEDRILIMRANDLILYESSIKTRVLPDVGSANLTVRLQVYGYIAFTAERYGPSTSIVAGTGLVAPTF